MASGIVCWRYYPFGCVVLASGLEGLRNKKTYFSTLTSMKPLIVLSGSKPNTYQHENCNNLMKLSRPYDLSAGSYSIAVNLKIHLK
jgi:hypothetical protein